MRPLVFLVLLILVVSCAEPQQPEEQRDETNHLPGLASPVRLAPESTFINLEDYFVDISLVESASLNGKSLEIDRSSKGVRYDGGIDGAIGNLEVMVQGQFYDIPVLASKKVLYTLEYPGSLEADAVCIAGNINGWNPKADSMRLEDGVWKLSKWLNPGLYQYQIVVGDSWKLDEHNPNSMSNGQGGFNSTFQVGDPKAQKPFIWPSELNSAGVFISEEGKSTNAELHVYWNNQKISSQVDNGDWLVSIPSEAKNLERSHLRAWLSNEKGLSNDILIPLSKGQVINDPRQLSRHDRQGNIMYFIMIDRFVDGNPANTLPIDDPTILPVANHYGGDFEGISQKIKDGYFTDLGINTIWVSPITLNPDSAYGLWEKEVTSRFSGYHGYWPISSKVIDYRFGDIESLNGLVRDCHDMDANILVDYVANHVHTEHPVYVNHPDWATSLYLPDGTMNTEKWDEYRLTTWFDTHLATLDFSRDDVIEAMTDSAMYWVDNFEIDGFRHDATKHIQEKFWRELTKKIKTSVGSEDPMLYQIGETYGNPELISSYVCSGQMDAQFDFNMYDALVDGFANEDKGFENIARVLNESLEWYGSNHVMGNITGNQDRARFISYADGSVRFDEDPKLAGWTREITNQGKEGYDKLKYLMTFIMTTPGIPCIYYGDEIGMPGGNDPDNRRMMLFDDLTDDQLDMRQFTKHLATIRRNHISLMYGQTQVVEADDTHMIISRKYLDEEIYIVLNKSNSVKFKCPAEKTPQALLEVDKTEVVGVNDRSVQITQKSPIGIYLMK